MVRKVIWTELVTIRPEDVASGKASFYSDLIINKMARVEALDVVGLSNAISLACSAVRMSSSVARIYIEELCLDYIEIPVLGKFSGAFFSLGRAQEVDWDSKKAEIEKNLKLDFELKGQLVVVSKNLPTDKMIPLCLWKLARSDRLKIMAAGYWINSAAALALEITKGEISKDPIGVELMTLSTQTIGEQEPRPKLSTGLEIFLKKGQPTQYSKKHKAVLSELLKGKP